MVQQRTSKRYMAWFGAATLFLGGSLTQAQQAAPSGGTAGVGRSTVVPTGGSPGGGRTTAPPRTAFAGRSGTHSQGQNSQGQFHANTQAGVQDPGAPRPSWELPRTVTPQWEIPNYNPVDPNPVAGNPRRHDSFGGGLGGFVGYGAVPGYSVLDPDSADQQTPAAGQYAAPPDPGQYQGQYVGQYGPAQDPGPAGYPPDYPGRPSDGSARQGYGAPPDYAGSRRAPYRPDGPAPAPAPPQSAAELTDGLEHPEITLVFHDGRPPLKVHSYALTGTALLAVESGKQTRIPLSDLDLPATEERNRANGVDFSIPGSR
jgi:hypothetical protein